MKKGTTSVFEWAYAVATLCFGTGLFLDGWAHNHLESSLESFFTPWHGVFYAGYLLSSAVLLLWTFSNRKSGSFRAFMSAIPVGHGLSLFGALLFVVGGFSDMLWHIIFGIEADIDALLSPSHLLLATGMVLMVTGGMRHFFATRKAGSHMNFATAFPLILSMMLTVMILTFMTQFLHHTQIAAFGTPPGTIFFTQATALASILLFSLGLTGTVSVALRRAGSLPFGTLTFVMGCVVSMLGVMQYGTEYIPAALLAGLAGDIYLVSVKPSVPAYRLLLCALPVLYYTLVFATLIALRGTWWSVHLVTGAVVYGGFAGLLVGAVAWPVSRD